MRPQRTMAQAALALVIGCSSTDTVPPNTPTTFPPTWEGAAGEVRPSRQPGFGINIVEAARRNDAYRRVLFTGTRTQIALMTLPVLGDMGAQAHPRVERLFVVVSGRATAVVDGRDSTLIPGDVIVVPAGTDHDIVNVGDEPLRLYTISSPPNHIAGRIQETKADAENDAADQLFGTTVR